jgi:hypothetical protein
MSLSRQSPRLRNPSAAAKKPTFLMPKVAIPQPTIDLFDSTFDMYADSMSAFPAPFQLAAEIQALFLCDLLTTAFASCDPAKDSLLVIGAGSGCFAFTCLEAFKSVRCFEQTRGHEPRWNAAITKHNLNAICTRVSSYGEIPFADINACKAVFINVEDVERERETIATLSSLFTANRRDDQIIVSIAPLAIDGMPEPRCFRSSHQDVRLGVWEKMTERNYGPLDYYVYVRNAAAAPPVEIEPPLRYAKSNSTRALSTPRKSPAKPEPPVSSRRKSTPRAKTPRAAASPVMEVDAVQTNKRAAEEEPEDGDSDDFLIVVTSQQCKRVIVEEQSPVVAAPPKTPPRAPARSAKPKQHAKKGVARPRPLIFGETPECVRALYETSAEEDSSASSVSVPQAVEEDEEEDNASVSSSYSSASVTMAPADEVVAIPTFAEICATTVQDNVVELDVPSIIPATVATVFNVTPVEEFVFAFPAPREPGDEEAEPEKLTTNVPVEINEDTHIVDPMFIDATYAPDEQFEVACEFCPDDSPEFVNNGATLYNKPVCESCFEQFGPPNKKFYL